MDDTGFSADDSVRYTGFHYVDWQFDNPDTNGVHQDIIYAIRTAYRGASACLLCLLCWSDRQRIVLLTLSL